MGETPGDRRTLSTARVVFLVIAAAAPLAAMLGNVPLAVARGNGVGLPAAFLVATAVLLCFAVGYSAMSRRLVNTGAFYTYIARGLGKIPGVVAAYLAVLSYTAMSCGLAAGFGYFTDLVMEESGVHTSWLVYAAIGLALVAFLGYRSVDLSAKVLGVLMAAEFVILLAFDVAAVADVGGAAFPAESFAPSHFFTGTVGIGLMFAFVSFVGFESAALYGEETKDPVRSIPRATYAALLSAGAFYLVTTWIIIGVGGVDRAQGRAQVELGDYVINLIRQEGGVALYNVAALFLCTSVLASYLALHNAASRYLFALGREGLFPRRLADYHPVHQSPHIGSAVVSTIETVLVVGFGLAGADPYATLAACLIGLGTLGIIALQAGAALSVVAFFRRRPDRQWWQTVLAPLLGFVGLSAGFVLAVANFSTLTDSRRGLVNAMPWLLLVAVAAGLGVGVWLRSRRPATYAALARTELRRRTHGRPPPIAYTRRYCLVGAGPAGLVMARQLLAEGVPFDWFERHHDVGGIWDMGNPGSPMYASAHFISSRFTSGFHGYPMPEDLPDYPSWRQIRDYLRAFARDEGLYPAVTLGVGVVEATPGPGDTWDVRLSTGEARHYDGLIAAPGVTWHPLRPTVPGESSYDGEVIHSVEFRDGLDLRGKRVVIVGAGNSGVDIACDAARHADQAYLSVRRGYRFVPKHLFGIPTDALVGGVVPPPKGVAIGADLNTVIDSVVGDLTRFGLPAPDHDVLTSHPIMNTQVIHHLAHGDLIAKPDVARLSPTGVVFTDGSEVEADVVILATGYQYSLPFLDDSLLTWDRGHPQLYLHVFSRSLDSLYVLGMIEFADAAYQRFEEMAQLVVMDVRARETGVGRDEWLRRKASDHPDLRGGMAYVNSPRHANYVESRTYQDYLAGLRDADGWPDLS